MKVSVVTAALNSADTIGECIRSVADQSHRDIEHVVIDGGSTDGTVETIRKAGIAHWVSEPDSGLYHAVNKGLDAATGHVVGVLGSDDLYADDRAVEAVVRAFEATGADSVYGDLLYVRARDLNRVVRNWASSPWRPGCFRRGWMPPHPAFFVRRELFERYGPFDTQFRLAADYELMLRFLVKHGITTRYVPRVLVKMRLGGVTNRGTLNLLRKSYEDYRAWKVNGLEADALTIGMTIAMKIGRKLPQFFRRRPEASA